MQGDQYNTVDILQSTILQWNGACKYSKNISTANFNLYTVKLLVYTCVYMAKSTWSLEHRVEMVVMAAACVGLSTAAYVTGPTFLRTGHWPFHELP